VSPQSGKVKIDMEVYTDTNQQLDEFLQQVNMEDMKRKEAERDAQDLFDASVKQKPAARKRKK
jgi:hypothetical protein